MINLREAKNGFDGGIGETIQLILRLANNQGSIDKLLRRNTASTICHCGDDGFQSFRSKRASLGKSGKEDVTSKLIQEFYKYRSSKRGIELTMESFGEDSTSEERLSNGSSKADNRNARVPSSKVLL